MVVFGLVARPIIGRTRAVDASPPASAMRRVVLIGVGTSTGSPAPTSSLGGLTLFKDVGPGTRLAVFASAPVRAASRDGDRTGRASPTATLPGPTPRRVAVLRIIVAAIVAGAVGTLPCSDARAVKVCFRARRTTSPTKAVVEGIAVVSNS